MDQVVGNRRTIRFFDPNQTVEPEKIQVMLEAANRSSRAVNADFVKAIVCYRDELTDEVREELKTPTTTVQLDLAPGGHLLVRRHDIRRRRAGAAQGTGRSRRVAGDPRLVARLRRRGRLRSGRRADVQDVMASTWAVSVEYGLAIAQAMLAGVDEGLGVGLHAFNAAAAKEPLKVPDHWIPMWLLLVGYPAESPNGGGQRPRRALEDNFYRGQYGQPWHEIPRSPSD
jgi:nitroreductase